MDLVLVIRASGHDRLATRYQEVPGSSVSQPIMKARGRVARGSGDGLSAWVRACISVGPLCGAPPDFWAARSGRSALRVPHLGVVSARGDSVGAGWVLFSFLEEGGD